MTDVVAMIGGWGMTELLVVLGIGILIFGAARIPDIAKSLGKAIKEFKKAGSETPEELDAPDKDDSSPA